VPDDAETNIDSDMIRTIYLGKNVPRGTKNVFVEWTGGYGKIPEPVKVVCAEIVNILYSESRRDPTLQSERLGDYSWTGRIFPQKVAENKLQKIYAELKPYTRLSIA